MNTATPLEVRLRQLDLRFVTVAPECHVTDERMALVVAGADPTEAEAAHLAACDECLDVLVALGDGLESLESLGELAGLSSPPAAPLAAERSTLGGHSPGASGGASGSKNKRRLGLVIGGLGFAFTAAAAVGLVTYREPTPEVAPVARTTPELAPAAAPPVGPAEPSAAPSVSAPPAVSDGPVAAALAVPPRALPPEPVDEAAEEPARPRPPATAARPPATPASPLAGPGAVATTVGEIVERNAAAFARAPVNAAGRGFGFLRLSATPQAQVFIDDKPYGWTPVFDLRLAEGPHDVRLVYTHPNAAEPEERFRVVIPAEEHWVVKRKNLRRAAP